MAKPQAWAIQVVDDAGNVMHMRHGSRPGEGRIVKFRTRKDADFNVDFIRNGMEDGWTVSVIPYPAA
jgi:hypothetical protein